jgi:hypothetical protein
MSASIQNNNSASPAAEKVKKITLSAQSTKHMVFGNWLIDRLVSGGQMTTDSVTESRKILGMWSTVEEQIVLYDGFASQLKANTKEMKALIRQFHKPPKAVKKAKTAASEGEKKRGRKKKEVTEEQDPILALNERLVAAAQSDEPIVQVPQYVRAPKEPDSSIKTPETPTQEELAMPAKPERPAKKKSAAPVVEDKELAKAQAKAAKEAEKEAVKAAKEAEKEAVKAAKEAEKEAVKAAKEAEKTAKAAAKPIKKKKKDTPVVLPIPVLVRSSPAKLEIDEEEEEELECEVFKLNGIEYLIDSSNTVYDRNTQVIIGTFDSVNKTIH